MVTIVAKHAIKYFQFQLLSELIAPNPKVMIDPTEYKRFTNVINLGRCLGRAVYEIIAGA